MADISKLSRLVTGIHRDVDLTSNTLVLQNVKLNLGGANNVTFAGTLTANRTISLPDANVNLGHIANLNTLSGVAAAAVDLGTFTGSTIPDSSTIKAALQSLETAVEGITVTPSFADDEFRITGSGDATKLLAFEVDGITAATTRTVTMPDADVNLADVNQAILQDGSRGMAANLSIDGNRIIDLAAPVAGTDAANKTYVDNAIEGVKPKEAVRAATTVNITLSGAQTIDGVSIVAGNRVLVKDQTASEENGIYVASAAAWSRSTDFDELTPINEIKGSYVAVSAGTTQAGQVWVCNADPTVLDTDPISFVYFNSITTLNPGNGIDITGTTISVKTDGEGLQFVSTELALELDGSTLSKSATGLKVAALGITDAELAANSVITAKIVNSAVTEAKIAASVAGNGLAGGGGAPLSVGASPTNEYAVQPNHIDILAAQRVRLTMVAGEAFAANTSFLVRMAVNGETGTRVYKADNNAATLNNFYVIGVAKATVAAAAGDNIEVTVSGLYLRGSSDAAFSASDIGRPIFLGASGAFTVTAPTTADLAVVRIGIVSGTNEWFIQPQVVGIV